MSFVLNFDIWLSHFCLSETSAIFRVKLKFRNGEISSAFWTYFFLHCMTNEIISEIFFFRHFVSLEVLCLRQEINGVKQMLLLQADISIFNNEKNHVQTFIRNNLEQF